MCDVSSEFNKAVAAVGGVVVNPVFSLNETSFTFLASGIAVVLDKTLESVFNLASSYSHSLSERERDAFDMKLRQVLKVERDKIQALSASRKMMSNDEAKHRGVVIHCLGDKANRVTKVAGELQLLRTRQVIAAKPALLSSNNMDVEKLVEASKMQDSYGMRNRHNIKSVVSDDDSDEYDEEFENKLKSEQIALKSRLDEELEGAKQAEKQMHELSHLMSIFNDKIMEQTELVSNMYSDVKDGTRHMDSAKGQLEQAREYNSSFRYYVVLFFVIATLLLLIYDRMD